VPKRFSLSIIVDEIIPNYWLSRGTRHAPFWGYFGQTSLNITSGQEQITKRYFAGYLFGM